MAFFFPVFDRDIGEGRAVKGAEVDQPFTPVNQPFVPHFFKGRVGSLHNLVVERKGIATPVYPRPESPDLIFKITAVLGYEIPNLPVQLFPREVEPALPFLGQVLFIYNLCFKTGVVSARQQHRSVAAQPMITNRDVFKRQSQRMANVQVAIGIRRRDDDAIALPFLRWREGSRFFPERVDISFVLTRFVDPGEFHSSSSFFYALRTPPPHSLLASAPPHTPLLKPFHY